MAVVNFTGLASGIDSSSLIQAILDQQRQARIKPLEKRVTELTDTNSSFSKLKELLSDLNSAASVFRPVNGSGLAKTVSSSAESRVTATASNAATNGTYAVTVSSLASNATNSFDDRFLASTDAINSSINDGASAASRTITVDVGTGGSQETVGIEITSTTSISDFVTQFNAASSKAEASIVNVGTSGSPSYAVVINSNNQGTQTGALSVSVGSEITTAGGGAFGSITSSSATDAQFAIAGIAGSFTRSSNTISDVIPGLTLNLQAAGTATVSVRDDPTVTASNVQEFVDAYNSLVEYIKENDAVSDDESGESKIFGSLSSTALDENVLSAIRQAFSSSSTSGGLVNTLADLGISTQRDGTLKLDTDALNAAIAQDPESVRTITSNLGETLASVDGTIAQYTRFNGLIGNSVQTNTNQIDGLNTRIEDIERALEKQKVQLTAQYARLESVVGKLNSQQSALTGLLPG